MADEKTPQQIVDEQKAKEEAAKAGSPEKAFEDPDTSPEVAEKEKEPSESLEEDLEFLGMSDDEFEKQLSDGGLFKEAEKQEKTEKSEESEESAKSAETSVTETEEKSLVEEKNSDTQNDKEQNDTSTVSDVSDTTDSESFDLENISEADAAAGFKKLMAPFKANGREVQARTPEEAIRLMQMGAGHVRYQNEVRPALVLAQTLKQNNIDNEKLNFLIELKNGNKTAIKKLVRDADLDPYEIETTEEAKAGDKDYRPKDYSADERHVTLSQTVASLQETDAGQQFVKHIRDAWDDGSRQALLGDPSILSTIAAQKEVGVYDMIFNEVERQRTLGTLAPGLSFLEAYTRVGNEMDQAGAFKELASGSTDRNKTGVEAPKESKVLATEKAEPVKKVKEDDGVSRIAPVKQSTPNTSPAITEDVLNMDDSEFEKLAAQFG